MTDTADKLRMAEAGDADGFGPGHIPGRMEKPVGPVIYYDLPLEDLAPVEDNIFNYLAKYDCVFTDCGRAALRLVSEQLGEGEVLVPDYSSFSVANGFPVPLRMVTYPMREDFSLDPETMEALITPETKLICVNHFCGRVISGDDRRALLGLKEKYGITLLEDATQSLLSDPWTFGDYCTSSLYKWFPSAGGGVLYSPSPLPEEMHRPLRKTKVPVRAYAMILKTLQLRGVLDGGSPVRSTTGSTVGSLIDDYFDRFETDNEADALLPVAGMTDLDRFLLRCSSVSKARAARTRNAITLSRALRYDLIHPVFSHFPDENDALLCYPVYVGESRSGSEKNESGGEKSGFGGGKSEYGSGGTGPALRDGLQAWLKEKNVYAPAYWHMDGPFGRYPETLERSHRILCLPVDQRYDEEDMRRVAGIINEWQARVHMV